MATTLATKAREWEAIYRHAQQSDFVDKVTIANLAKIYCKQSFHSRLKPWLLTFLPLFTEFLEL